MIICVTGPMAAGKNAAAAILEKKGFAAVDADLLVHDAAERALPEILKAFGPEAEKRGILLTNSDGSLNRRALGSLIFTNPVLLSRQESIVYPVITQMADKFIAAHKNSDIVLNATVLYKIPVLLDLCSTVLFIDAPLIIRFLRARSRDRMKATEIFARFHSQSNLFAKYKNSHADIKRVWNTGSLNALEQKIDLFLLKCRNKGI